MSGMSRDEHLAWCKRRALEYLDAGEPENAVASMRSDLNKHPETRGPSVLQQLGLMHLLSDDLPGIRRWIEGFN